MRHRGEGNVEDNNWHRDNEDGHRLGEADREPGRDENDANREETTASLASDPDRIRGIHEPLGHEIASC